MDSGVARIRVDLDEYREQLERRLGKAHEVMRIMIHKAQHNPRRIVFPEGDAARILRAAQIIVEERIANPILLGNEESIRNRAAELRVHLDGVEIVDPATAPRRSDYIEELFRLRQRKGLTRREAAEKALNRNSFGALMVRTGDADGLIAGVTQHYPDTIRPALEVIPVREGYRRVAGLYLMITAKGDLYFFADATVNIDPTADDLAEIAIEAAETARRFNIEPRVAMLSFSNFGSTRHPFTEKVRQATDIAKRRAPDLVIDGEMQADTAVTPEFIERTYPFSTLKTGANVLVFPTLEAGNVAYKLLQRIGGCEAIGPLLMGLSKPVHVLQREADVNEIVNVTAIAVVDANELSSDALQGAAAGRGAIRR
jgi:malate dehydrogenase (oxaloacetate-decarboxylating)(NADP+)